MKNIQDGELLSNCCGADALYDLPVVDEDGSALGICSRCRDHAVFFPDGIDPEE